MEPVLLCAAESTDPTPEDLLYATTEADADISESRL